jgi:hypothetical protein
MTVVQSSMTILSGAVARTIIAWLDRSGYYVRNKLVRFRHDFMNASDMAGKWGVKMRRRSRF